MREILFRGKDRQTGKWVFGLPFYGNNGVIDGIEGKDDKLYTIDPETLGEYTGLTDKNGNKVFEGDIIRYEDVFLGELANTCVRWGGGDGSYPAFDLTDHIYECNGLQVVCTENWGEVIGNCYDNPEILTGGEK